MNTVTKASAAITLILALANLIGAQGYIVPNGVGYSVNGPGHYGISVVHDPTNRYTTGFDLIALGRTLPTVYTNTFAFSPIVDVSVRVFLVGSNQPVSLSPILMNSYIELGNAPSYVFDSAVPFYVGLYTGNQNYYPPDGIYTDPLFGWALLVNNRGVIEMLDSALEYKGGGIFAGTQNIMPIPEPGSVALLAMGALLLGSYRRRNSRKINGVNLAG